MSSSMPTDARALRSRAALNKALLLLLEKKPFDQITVREITKDAKIGYATFFRQFASKEELLNDLAAAQIDELLNMTIPILFRSNSFESCRALCTYVDEHRTLWAALLTGGAAGTVRSEFIRQARMWAAKTDPQDSWLPADLSVVYGTGGTIDLLAWWLGQRDHHSVERIAEILDRLIIGPVLAHVPHERKARSGT